MAVDQYGSYTNNALIYEAITGNTTEATGSNTLLPLNTPIIDASINDKFAVINLTGNKLRFVSMDNGTTTPATFGVDSANYTVIKEGLIWDITIPSSYVCYHVGALDNGILFSDFNNSEKVMLMKNSSLTGITSTTTSTSYIHILTIDSNPVYYYSSNDNNEFEIDHDNFCFIGGTSSSDQNLVTNTGIVSATVQNHTVHDGKFSYTSGDKVYVKGNFANFSPNGSGTTSFDTFTEASIFNAYTITKAWVYGNAILALSSDNNLLAAGDNTNHRLTTGTDDTLITTPVVVQTSMTAINDVVYDKSVSSTATTTSYIVAPETLSADSNDVLNLEQNATNSSKRFTNTVQLSNEEAVEGGGGSSSDSPGGGGSSVEEPEDFSLGTIVSGEILGVNDIHYFTATTSGRNVYYTADYVIGSHSAADTVVAVTVGPGLDYGYASNDLSHEYTANESKVFNVTKENISVASGLYSSNAASLTSGLDTYLTSIKLNSTITETVLGAQTPRLLESNLRKSDIYYKLQYTIGQHTANDTEVQVTLGPNIEWGYDANDL